MSVIENPNFLTPQDLSLHSLLHLEDLLRKMILLPQSAKVQSHIKKLLGQELFPMYDCLTGLATAEDLSLENSLDEIYNFIINNLWSTCVTSSKIQVASILDQRGRSLSERLEIIHTYLKNQDDHTRNVIVSSLDMSQFSKEELLAFVRRTPELFFKGIYGLDIFI